MGMQMSLQDPRLWGVIYPEMELLDPMVILFFVEESLYYFPQQLHLFTFPLTEDKSLKERFSEQLLNADLSTSMFHKTKQECISCPNRAASQNQQLRKTVPPGLWHFIVSQKVGKRRCVFLLVCCQDRLSSQNSLPGVFLTSSCWFGILKSPRLSTFVSLFWKVSLSAFSSLK